MLGFLFWACFCMRWLYTLVFYIAIPFLLLRLYQRGRRAPAYRERVAERFGFFSAPCLSKQPVWVHAVSLGESIAIAPLVEKLLEEGERVVMTCSTPTGSERIQTLFGQRVFHCYAPYDYPGAVGRFLQRTQPKLALMMETEVWPNTLYYCRQYEIPAVLINARMSASSARGYARLKALSRPMFQSFAQVLAQSEADAHRLEQLGASSLAIVGSLKFDVSIEAEQLLEAKNLRQQLPEKTFVWIAASTHEGEDEQLLAAHKKLLQQHSQALLLLVPRHPERFEQVADLIAASDLSCQRRSQLNTNEAVTSQVLLGDSVGELMTLYGAADVAFIGGSLVPNGGHNFLEAAVWGLPLLCGPHVFNFQQISDLLQEHHALIMVQGSEPLAGQLSEWCEDKTARVRAGEQAKALLENHKGSLQRQWDLLQGWL